MVCAKAARESRKGEDYTCVLLEPHGQPPAAFAVFDGHSGKRTGKLCAEIICQRILARGPPFEPAATDELWFDYSHAHPMDSCDQLDCEHRHHHANEVASLALSTLLHEHAHGL